MPARSTDLAENMSLNGDSSHRVRGPDEHGKLFYIKLYGAMSDAQSETENLTEMEVKDRDPLSEAQGQRCLALVHQLHQLAYVELRGAESY